MCADFPQISGPQTTQQGRCSLLYLVKTRWM